MRTTEELIDKLSEERIWRIKEITTVTSLAFRQNLKPVEVEFYCRAGTALMYAHWEGFVKRAAVYYLKHVAYQRMQISEMADFVLALYMNQSIRGEGQTSAAQISALGERLLRNQEYKPKLKWDDVISTNSNLSSSALRKILGQIGLDHKLFELKFKVIDGTIVKHRNAIAHGEKGDVDLSTLEQISAEVVSLISLFRDMLENAAVLKSYRR
jgi:hypothetical protein